MPYLRAFSSLGCPNASFDEACALAARHGLDAVELRALGGTVELPGYLAATHGSPEALAEDLAAGRHGSRGITVASFDSSFRLIGPGPGARESLLDFVPWAEALGVRWIRVFDGGKTADAAELAEAADNHRWWLETRAARGWSVDLMVETHDCLFTADAILRALERLPGLAVLWDTHHTWKRGGEDPLMTWGRVSRHVVHVHVKDSISVPSARHPYTYVVPGTGEFPAAPLFSALREGFAGVVSLEWERLWHPSIPPLEEALASARDCNWW
jgi:sugar phosphate isomerase/epimerase